MSGHSGSRALAVTLLAGGLAGFAAPAMAGREHRPAPLRAVRWLAPAPDADLVAGASARFAWAPGAAFAALEVAEEWELFVSYDGGRSWPVRLTPHLDVAKRAVVATLPELAGDDVRFLMRVGDERVEYEVEHPARFRVAPPRARRAPAGGLLSMRGRRGESARASGAGTVLWWEGDRGGRSSALAAYSPLPRSWQRSSWREAGLPRPLGAPIRAPALQPAAQGARAASFAAARAVTPEAAPAIPRQLLPRLQTCRSNR